jgi:hypothetical protein
VNLPLNGPSCKINCGAKFSKYGVLVMGFMKNGNRVGEKPKT